MPFICDTNNVYERPIKPSENLGNVYMYCMTIKYK